MITVTIIIFTTYRYNHIGAVCTVPITDNLSNGIDREMSGRRQKIIAAVTQFLFFMHLQEISLLPEQTQLQTKKAGGLQQLDRGKQ